jgi:hypothetical protein
MSRGFMPLRSPSECLGQSVILKGECHGLVSITRPRIQPFSIPLTLSHIIAYIWDRCSFINCSIGFNDTVNEWRHMCFLFLNCLSGKYMYIKGIYSQEIFMHPTPYKSISKNMFLWIHDLLDSVWQIDSKSQVRECPVKDILMQDFLCSKGWTFCHKESSN